MSNTARRLVVGRLRKPHGLKGDCAVFPLTDDPETVFIPGRTVWVVDLAGDLVGDPLVISRSRRFHREWLLAFRGREVRDDVEALTGTFLSVPAEELTPPEGDEVYLDELPGYAVQHVDGTPLGLVTAWYDMPAGLMLEVQGPKREFLLPYRKELVRSVDRVGRRLVIEPPEGLVDLA
ncbi:MAG: rRNA processing protein RimM [Gemmatimonadetes bacterium]|nr:rRNA processing protein RimM [Gemmatimonadota bacterium]